MPSYPLSSRELESRRQWALDRLTEDFAADLIHLDDYESRVAKAQSASTPEAIEAALAGIEARRVDPRIAGQTSLACILSERQVNGDWLSGDHVSSLTFMGSTKIDLRDTALPPGRLRIDAFCFMGELKVIVPRGLPVRLSAFPFMGQASADRGVERHIDAGKPYVEISGFAMMGSLTVVAMD